MIASLLPLLLLVPSPSPARRAEGPAPASGSERTFPALAAELERAAADGREALAVPMEDGRLAVARRLRGERTRARGYTWLGRIDGESAGWLALAVQDDALVGTLRTADGLRRLRSGPTGALVVRREDEGALPGCGGTLAGSGSPFPTEPTLVGTPGGPFPRTLDRTPVGGGQGDVVIDIVVAWTQEAEDLIGGPAATQALIDLAVLETNQAYDNSLVSIDLRLVYSSLVDYVESGEMFDHLSRLRDPSDGIMDEVHEWRDTYGGDAVSLIVADSSACGVSYNNGFPPVALSESIAFSCVSSSCATGMYAFGHELGHNFGLDHDREHTNKTPSQPFAFGYEPESRTWHTIMALGFAPTPSPRILHYSNPDVEYQGFATGLSLGFPNSADCALALDLNAPTLAAFRPTTVPDAAAGPGRLAFAPEGRRGGSLALTLDDPFEDLPAGAWPVVVLSEHPWTPGAPLASFAVGRPWDAADGSQRLRLALPASAPDTASVRLALLDGTTGALALAGARTLRLAD